MILRKEYVLTEKEYEKIKLSLTCLIGEFEYLKSYIEEYFKNKNSKDFICFHMDSIMNHINQINGELDVNSETFK